MITELATRIDSLRNKSLTVPLLISLGIVAFKLLKLKYFTSNELSSTPNFFKKVNPPPVLRTVIHKY